MLKENLTIELENKSIETIGFGTILKKKVIKIKFDNEVICEKEIVLD